VTDQLAEAGYIVIAPDLLSGSAPGGGGTAKLGSGDAVRKAISSLPPEQIPADLNAVSDHVAKLPASNGKVAVGVFCLGGIQTFRFATNNKDIKAAFVFYGSVPENESDYTRIVCPVYFFYDGAGHGFMRAGEAPDATADNKKAREATWQLWKDALKKL
jgi:carboxymethylenebutenolidase